MRSYTVKENHIGSEDREILWYTQKGRNTDFDPFTLL